MDGDPPPPPPPAPAAPPPGAKVCTTNSREKEPCTCSTDDNCLTRDYEICFSERLEELRRPHSVVWSPADWYQLYVTSEEHGKIVQIFTANGTLAASSSQLANQMMGLDVNAYQHDYGLCRDNNPKDGNYHCTGASSSIEGGNMPAEVPRKNCAVDSECQPSMINRTFGVCESAAESCNYQAVVKLSNATADGRVLSNDGRPIAGQGEGQVLLKFEGWLRDVSF